MTSDDLRDVLTTVGALTIRYLVAAIVLVPAMTALMLGTVVPDVAAAVAAAKPHWHDIQSANNFVALLATVASRFTLTTPKENR